jgi:UDP-N-acetyl-D-mannosaminuronic acid transferase (WecB/TagA/CpsF family)
MRQDTYVSILGLRFFNRPLPEALNQAKKGGLITFPSAPGLAEIPHHPAYYKALMHSDMVLADSGLLVLLWRLIRRQKVERISGYVFLKKILEDTAFKKANATFWVMPSVYHRNVNRDWLNDYGVKVSDEYCYIAPHYNRIPETTDPDLLQAIELKKPRFIILCIAGGIQEKLGLYLKQNLSYKPSILCTGAAIAFCSGLQAHIPLWADKLYLGWLLRIVYEPSTFFKRYWRAKRLIGLVLRHKENTPLVLCNSNTSSR